MTKIEVLEHINYINAHNDMPKEAQEKINELVEIIYNDESFASECERFIPIIFSGEDCKEESTALAEKYGVYDNLLRLVICQMCSMQTKKNILEKGLSEDHFLQQTLDMAIWTKTHYELNGKWGLSEYGWNLASIRGGIIRLGRMQCENPGKLNEDLGVTIAGIELKKGMTRVGLHIPEGDSLTKEKRLDSYRRIYEYHKLQGMCIFDCHSWLFHPLNEEILPANSNILDFMRDFKMIEFEENEYGDMWRVFGKHWALANRNFDLLPQDTGLRRAYANLLKSGKKPAIGKGVLLFDGEKIYNE